MLSSKHLQNLPSVQALQKQCKAIATLDAIICPEWEHRYYSYNAQWDEGEHFAEIRNGEGDHTMILFKHHPQSGYHCVINGFMHELEQPSKQDLLMGLPEEFSPFINGEPIASLGTTFCLWNTDATHWKSGKISQKDGSEQVLYIFDNRPETYLNWATEYYKDNLKTEGFLLQTVAEIYKGQPLTKKMVLSLVADVSNWRQLKDDLEEIGYPFEF